MKVYWIKADIDKYCSLSQDLGNYDFLTAHKRWNSLSSCLPVLEPLTPPAINIYQSKLRRGDFWAFSPFATFAMPAASIEKVRPFLEESGELITIQCEGEMFAVFNALKCVDCVDPITEELGILNRAYIPDRLPSGIFRDPRGVYMFATEVTGDPATEFKARVEQERMTGMIFREVWDSGNMKM